MHLKTFREFDVKLFFDTIGYFVSCCPAAPRRYPFNPHKPDGDIHLDNQTQALRHEIGLLPLSLSEARASLSLSAHDLDDAARALQDVLQLIDDCIATPRTDSGPHGVRSVP